MQLNLAGKDSIKINEESIYHAHGDEITYGYGPTSGNTDYNEYGYIDSFYEDEACTVAFPFDEGKIYLNIPSSEYYKAQTASYTYSLASEKGILYYYGTNIEITEPFYIVSEKYFDNANEDVVHVYVRLSYTPTYSDYSGYLNFYIYGGYEGYRGINIEYGFSPEDLFNGQVKNNEGETILSSYNGIDISRGVHYITLNRNLNTNECITFRWKNGNELKIINEPTYIGEDEEHNKGLFPSGTKTKVYRSSGGSYNELGKVNTVVKTFQFKATVPKYGKAKAIDIDSELYEIISDNYEYTIYKITNSGKEEVQEFRVVSASDIYDYVLTTDKTISVLKTYYIASKQIVRGKEVITYTVVSNPIAKDLPKYFERFVNPTVKDVVFESTKTIINLSEVGAFLFKDTPNRFDKSKARYIKEV